ncbi:MAG: (2Fe-2S)-binding protein [Candidatus Rokubacteria bacterium]|nr:(2Fe-2S)-binding protein [Candidatus Rokubacteria bacterium]MBI3824690.1 (2Fe-2S)-binding protein [Candidatus Rokubacteria bacterium]
MPRLTIDGKPIEVPAGTNIIEAARLLGIEVPHYCYHPGLSIAGQCRLCMVDLDNAPRPTIACNTQAADGMVVMTDTERVRETRRSIMEFHLINHPLDCPVCDQAGECWLQIYYMKHGLYDPRMVDDKVHKPKAVPLGPHVMLDAERCILCSRCVRFCDEITGTGELGIFHRGDHSEIGLFPGADLTNKYSGNVVDICPVGALTDRDFRFQVRVWYLDTARSICQGCARGCNIEVHTSRRRPHHAQGRRVARLKPRYHAEVNRWWICDEGRYGFAFVDDASRLTFPVRREGQAVHELLWDEAIPAVADALRRHQPDEIALLASPKMANEDLWAVRALAERLGTARVAFRVPPAAGGDQDDLLIRADKNPNTRGAELLGLDGDAAAIMADLRAGAIKCLWIFGHDVLHAAWPPAEAFEALTRAQTLIFSGTNASSVSALAHLVLPAAAWVEREGTVTNFEGRVQRFRRALDPLGAALPEHELIGRVLATLGAPVSATRAEHWFRALAAAVPAFAGMTYASIGDTGQMVSP